jgi:sarcosine oxidase delta subunit
MSKIICPVCGSDDAQQYHKHGVSHVRCKCGYDSGDNWRDYARHEDDEREQERNPARQGRQR